MVSDGLKNGCNEIQSKTVREGITSFASVEYVIVLKTLTRCDNRTQLCHIEPSEMLGISSSDKDGDNGEETGRKDSVDYQC